MTPEERDAREAELYKAVKDAEAVVREASKAPDRENGDPDYVAWWQGMSDAHIGLRDAYGAAIKSGLWSTDSLMWTALLECHWHNAQEAKRTKHEADLASDRAESCKAAQAERAS